MEIPEICAECGGLCCKAGGAQIFPEEVKSFISLLLENQSQRPGKFNIKIKSEKLNSEQIYFLLNTGMFAVDIYETPTQCNALPQSLYYLRTARKGAERSFDPLRRGECAFLTGSGCSLNHSERPVVCRELIPTPPICRLSSSKFNRKNCAEAWKEHNALLEAVFRKK